MTATQVADIDSLVLAGKLQRVTPDIPKAERFLTQANDGVADAPAVKSPNVLYSIAYDAAHDCGEAILAAYGLKTTNGAGQHVAVGDVLLVVFPNPPASAAAQHYVQMRMARNGIHYRATAVGQAQANTALATATALLKATTLQLN